ncbi:imidazole glycerol phosphate synthase subunit HisH [bacterium]|nr:imidazole glycerol phosphate synthase subunit HisH [bacterium]
MQIGILDYGVGNMGSVKNAITHLGHTPIVSSDEAVLSTCDCLVLPGQGAFGTAISALKQTGLVPFIQDWVTEKKPFVGICVGFQLLFEGSEEKGAHDGLGLLPGKFKHFPENIGLSIPHMGWNPLQITQDINGVFDTDDTAPFVYFVHSYYMPVSDSLDGGLSATAKYGVPFVAVVQRENLLACQFHPEKSGDVGIGILERFFASL